MSYKASPLSSFNLYCNAYFHQHSSSFASKRVPQGRGRVGEGNNDCLLATSKCRSIFFIFDKKVNVNDSGLYCINKSAQKFRHAISAIIAFIGSNLCYFITNFHQISKHFLIKTVHEIVFSTE